MSNLLLAKPDLPGGWFDCSVGEAYLVRDNLFNIFNVPNSIPNISKMFEYPNPNGYQPLVKLLEEKHQAPVIITNGAKQAIGACCYTFQQLGKKTIGIRSPYWALIPPLISMHGMNWAAAEYHQTDLFDSYLCVAPGNPDGWMKSSYLLYHGLDPLRDEGIPVVHDGAYYSHAYLPRSPNEPKLWTMGDAQIFSISKMLGLSGLRIGYVVCPNPEFYKHILYYMENMTVGVSTISQIFLYEIMCSMRNDPAATQQFEDKSFLDLQNNKILCKQIDPEILEIPNNIEDIPGMFLWAKQGSKADFQKAKINVIDGAHFGAPGYIRMNLAFPESEMTEIVTRLNSVL
jgi:aspartate/methionine/tyrosine aminotransferase